MYRGERISDGTPVIVKLGPAGDQPENALFHEYAITRTLDSHVVPEPLSFSVVNARAQLVYRDDGMTSLAAATPENGFPTARLLRLAVRITEALETVHAAHILHKDINPSNIITDPETDSVKLIDFELSSRLKQEESSLGSYSGIRGTLAYISPEQTGRINRPIDYRSDLYSLGATFYELACGRPPFDESDPVSMVHAQIVRTPQSVDQIASGVPSQLSSIILRLLQKRAEDRYQSLYGLREDLKNCLHQLEQTGEIIPFPLGECETAGSLTISQQLYGRDRETEELAAVFDRVIAGRCEALFVSGPSGVGKTALIREIHRPMTAGNGLFAFGKFDQMQRDLPYSAIVRAFDELCRQLASDQADRPAWRTQLQKGLGANAGVISELIPSLHLLLEDIPPLVPIDPADTQRRLSYTFREFVKVIAGPSHPLVLVLDDLQWADTESFSLLSSLFLDAELSHLLLIGSHRNETTAVTEMLARLQVQLENESVPLTRVQLSSLGTTDVCRLLEDTLHMPSQTLDPLARLIVEKTGGNPFAVRQFLHSLADQRILRYDADARRWVWDEKRIHASETTANVVEMLARIINELPPATTESLHTAACIGNTFSTGVLSTTMDRPLPEILSALEPAMVAGLAVPVNDDYKYPASQSRSRFRFFHDKIQQAAYALHPGSERQKTHLRVAHAMLESEPSLLADRTFDIAEQLAAGLELLTDRRERSDAATHLLDAGRKAKSSGSHDAAHSYLTRALECLTPGDYGADYHLSFEVHAHLAESALLTGRFEELDALCEQFLPQTRSLADEARLRETQILARIAQNRRPDAIEIALDVLTRLSVPFPASPSQTDVGEALERTATLLQSVSENDLLELPVMKDESLRTAMRIMATATSAAFVVAPLLMVMFILRQVELSVNHGLSAESAYALVFYGVVLCGIVGDLEAGYRYGELATRLVDRQEEKGSAARVAHVFNDLVRPWKDDLRSSLDDLERNYHVGRRLGDTEFAAYSAHIYCCYLFCCGKMLPGVRDQIESFSDAIAALSYADTHSWNLIYLQTVQNLTGECISRERLSGPTYDAQATRPLHLAAGDKMALCYLHINSSFLAYLFYDYAGAAEHALAVKPFLDGATGKYTVVLHYFYESLALLARWDVESASGRSALLQTVQSNQERLARWAAAAPENFAHKYDLVEAEIARVEQRMDAFERYDRAIAGAHAHLFRHEEAIALERAGIFHLSIGSDRTARLYLNDALAVYQEWGAYAKCAHLRETYPEHLVSRRRGTSAGGSSGVHDLDQLSIAKASQSISSEVRPDHLIATLVSIAIENAGANKAVLVIMEDGKPLIQARRDLEHDVFETMQRAPLETATNVPVSVLQATIASLAPILLADATRDEHYWRDQYVRDSQPRSVMSVPLVNHNRLAGVLYLENSKLENVFGPDSVATVQILASQAAISIRNAQLFEEVRSSEERFELAMQAANDGLWDWDLTTDTVYLSPGWKRLVGYGEHELRGDKNVWERLTLPEDVSRAKRMFAMLRSGEMTSFSDEFRMRHKDGRWVDILSRGRAVYDEQGTATRIVGTHQDITERKATERRIRQDLEERELLLRELYHRTKNNMQIIVSLMRMKVRSDSDKEVQDLVADVGDKIESMSLVHQMLYESNDLSRIDIGDYVTEFASTVLGSADARARMISLSHDVVHASVSIDVAIPLGMVLSELITNSVKHAFSPSEPDPPGGNQICIGVREEGESITITYHDSGCGVPEGVDLRQSDSMGLQTVFALVEQQLGGSVSWTPGDGLAWKLSVPVSRGADRLGHFSRSEDR